MKTATVTWITYNNYGTLLQAYALQKQIEKLGFENFILSDEFILRPKKVTDSEKLCFKVSDRRMIEKIKRLVLHPIQCVKSICGRLLYKSYNDSQILCEDFKKTCLTVYPDTSSGNLHMLNDEFDVFICGSDQIWSQHWDMNGYYYLDFANKKRISYAPSFGMDNIPMEKRQRLLEYLSGFSALSVRESCSAEQASELLGRNVEWVCDPTLLHDRSFWCEFCKAAKIPRKKYLLCYFLSDKPWYLEYAKKLAAYLKLKLYIIPNIKSMSDNSFLYRRGVGPKEFVALFKNAEFILTDSYHGSIFSIIFERQFIHLKRFDDGAASSQNVRIESLFNHLQLSQLIVTEKSFYCDDIKFINYEKINIILQDFKHSSIDYLKDSLTE